LERFEERRFLAGFVGSGTAMDVDVAGEAGAEDVPAKKSMAVRFFDRALENVLDVKELAANVDVSDLRADGIAGNRAAFNEQVRIPVHDQVILEGARLTLVGVAGDVARLLRLAIDELPFHAGREAGAASPAKARRLHDLDDLIGRLRERLLQPFIAFVPKVEIE